MMKKSNFKKLSEGKWFSPKFRLKIVSVGIRRKDDKILKPEV